MIQTVCASSSALIKILAYFKKDRGTIIGAPYNSNLTDRVKNSRQKTNQYQNYFLPISLTPFGPWEIFDNICRLAW
jgi:hypothetical protein